MESHHFSISQNFSILNNVYVISKIHECMQAGYEEWDFNDTFGEIRDITEIAHSKGVLYLKWHTTKNQVIQEFIDLILGALKDVSVQIQPRHIALPAFMITPRILYGGLEGISFVKTVLIYEAILMAVDGYGLNIIDTRLKAVIRKG